MTSDEKVPFSTFLRELADFYDEHPLVPEPYWMQGDISIYLYGDSGKEVLRSIGSFEKEFNDNYLRAIKIVGGRRVVINAARDKVCTAKVVGKKIVPETVIPSSYTPEQVIPAHEEDIVEWDCAPVLAPSEPYPTDKEISDGVIASLERASGCMEPESEEQ